MERFCLTPPPLAPGLKKLLLDFADVVEEVLLLVFPLPAVFCDAVFVLLPAPVYADAEPPPVFVLLPAPVYADAEPPPVFVLLPAPVFAVAVPPQVFVVLEEDLLEDVFALAPDVVAEEGEDFFFSSFFFFPLPFTPPIFTTFIYSAPFLDLEIDIISFGYI